ncbi:MAG: flagellar hook-associated protein FlgK [Lachnobacterium sp.]|nr:flagellar hook-associated protein FlgK [Lachnobacterium sp.]
MANGFGSFYVGNSGLVNAQNAINVTANNLANVDTPGYVREQVRFSDKSYITRVNPTIRTNMQQNGLGVSVSDVAHARDIFLDKAYRRENGRSEFYSSMYNAVAYVEDILQETDGEEFKQSVADLWKAFQEFGKDPSNSTNQSLILQKSELFLSRTASVYSDLQKYQENINEEISDKIDRVNEIGKRVNELNYEIMKVESNGLETAMTLRDERDYLIDELSGYLNIEAKENSTGQVIIKAEGVTFVDEDGFNKIGLRVKESAKGTGFYTPFWGHLSDAAKGETGYTDVFDFSMDISTEYNNDIGSIKALLYARGENYGEYEYLDTKAQANFSQEFKDKYAYSKIDDCVVAETQAEVTYLLHKVILAMNDIMVPNKTMSADEIQAAAGSGATSITAYDANGKEYQITSSTKILDAENCNVGADKKIPPEELFVRDNCERYTEVTYKDQNDNFQTLYVYNEEDEYDTNTLYKIGNVSINPDLLKEVTKMPVYRQNGTADSNGAVDMSLGTKITAAWQQTSMVIAPDDTVPCNFEDYYDKIIDRLGISGNVYYTASQTMSATVASVDNQRQQVIGVSSDEELTNMIKYQSAYNAASRYITVISEMTDTIVSGLI